MAIAAQNPLGLRIPEPAPPKGELLARPREMEEWIERLPVASATSTAKLLVRAIQDLNRVKLPPGHRIQLAELLTPPISYAVNTLEQRYADASFPLSEKSRRTAYVCNRLNEELAFSYKLAIHDVAMGKIGYQERKLLIVALFRAVRHLADVIYQSTLIYDPPTRHVWRELHNLFAFAETNKWSSTKVKVKTADEPILSTLRESYLQALLFASSAPYRLRQKEMRALYRRLQQWTELARLGSISGQQASGSRFVVQLKKDEPPQHSELVGDAYTKPALLMDTGALIQQLHRFREELPEERGGLSPGGQSGDLTRNTVQRLMQAWGSAPRRQYVRTRLNFDLEVAVGLNLVYTHISGDNGRSQAVSSFASGLGGMDVEEVSMESTFSSDLLDNESGLTLVPIENSDGVFLRGYDNFGMVTQTERAPAPDIWQEDQEPEPGVGATTKLRTVNESAGGYCIRWQSTNTPGIKIGELVGIQAPNNPTNYGLTVVRWMRNEPDAGLLVGLQQIAPNAFAVTAIESDRRRRTPTKCLLVPELKSAGRPASLITPTMPFKVGEHLQIRHGDTEQGVRLIRLLEFTGAFAQFQFEYD